MSISTYISIPVFIVSFIIGIVCIFVFGPETKTVSIYPSPDNYKDLTYQDNSNQCFTMSPLTVECPSNLSDIHDIPIQ